MKHIDLTNPADLERVIFGLSDVYGKAYRAWRMPPVHKLTKYSNVAEPDLASHCCGARINFPDFCGDCGEHCSGVELE